MKSSVVMTDFLFYMSLGLYKGVNIEINASLGLLTTLTSPINIGVVRHLYYIFMTRAFILFHFGGA